MSKSISVVIRAVVAAVSFSYSGPAFAECGASVDVLDWSEVDVGPSLPTPEVPDVPDAGINSAQQPDIQIPPFSFFGKFDSSVNGNARRCTAQFVSENVVMTAAHCVRDKNGTWLDRFMFSMPGPETISQETAVCILTTDSWVQGSESEFNWAADQAFVVFESSLVDDHLELAEFESATFPIATAIGFPQNIGGGETLSAVTGFAFDANELGSRNGGLDESTALLVHHEPRFGLGISGGAWLVGPRDNGTGRFRIVGLSATSRITAALGPKISQCSHDLLALARRNCDIQ